MKKLLSLLYVLFFMVAAHGQVNPVVTQRLALEGDTPRVIIAGKTKTVYYDNKKVTVFNKEGKLLKTFLGLKLYDRGHVLTENEDSVKLYAKTIIQLIDLEKDTKTVLPCSIAGDFNEEGIFIGRDTAFNFYDYSGKKLNTVPYYSVVNFSDGICALQETATDAPHLADKSFKKIKDLYTYFRGPYSEGIAYATNQDNSLIYYLDKNGYEAFNMQAKEGGRCINGFITIKGNDGRFFHVNKKGIRISAKTWEAIGSFNEGLAFVKDKGKWGYIDTLGKIVIGLRYDEASAFFSGAAMVKEKGRYFLINTKGQPVSSTTYDAAGTPGNGTFPVQKNNKIGLIDSKGRTIIDFLYESILYMAEDRVWAAKNGKWGLLDNKGTALSPFIYQAAYEFEGGFARVVKDDKIGVINKQGKLIVPAVYNSMSTIYKGKVTGIKPDTIVTYPVN